MSKKTKNLKKKNYKTKKNNLKKKKSTRNQKAGSSNNNTVVNYEIHPTTPNSQSDQLFTGTVYLPDGSATETEFCYLPYDEDEAREGQIIRGLLSKIARDISTLTDEQKHKLIYLIDLHERSDENSEFNNIRIEIVTNFNYFLNNLESLNVEHGDLDVENASRLLNILTNLTLSIERLINLILIGRGENGLPNYSNLFANITHIELQQISSYFVNQLISPYENIINHLIQSQH